MGKIEILEKDIAHDHNNQRFLWPVSGIFKVLLTCYYLIYYLLTLLLIFLLSYKLFDMKIFSKHLSLTLVSF